ncbi:sensor histidine kinase [Nonomuraea rhizosphaerae]|uniref:sensor histidine kinase n=1 Tax=Nonomuraea rhizosphaerae TaxID=2665663 RepID=UPI001C5DDAF4|nr:histidine kinase [Nonomuraea rhizosphaerae]
MRNGTFLALIAATGLVNGLYLDHISLWRQFLFVGVAVAAYLHGRHLPVRRDWLVLGAVAAPGVVALVVRGWDGVGALCALGIFAVLPWLTGRFRRQQAELIEAGRQRVRQLEREQSYLAERVTLQERGRIAEEVHDSLGHELALIALRAGALELAADMSERNREAAAQLRISAVTATDRLRHTIGLLREPRAAVAAEHPGGGGPESGLGADASGGLGGDAGVGLGAGSRGGFGAGPGGGRIVPVDESIEALVERAAGAGMAVTLHRDAAAADLPPLLDRAAHRVAQESLTNAARYAPGAEVRVGIERDAGTITVTVGNGPPAAAMVGGGLPSAMVGEGLPSAVTASTGTAASAGTGTPAARRGGTGLAALRERMRLMGGTLEAGPAHEPPTGGFTVRATLPYPSTREGAA